MKFQERTITLKDGRHCILCPILPEYAEEMISYLKKTSAETDFLLRYPDEVTFTPEAERELLTKFYEDPRTVMMAAFVDGRLAGNGSITGVGERRKIRHRCLLGIALYQAYWGLGIGTAMIDYMCELAGQIGYRQAELDVAAENEQARALYKKCGFIESGRHHHALLYDDGSYHDLILMYRKL